MTNPNSVEHSSSGSEYVARDSTVSSDATGEMDIRENPSTKLDYLVSANENDLIDLKLVKKKMILKSGFDFSTAFLKKRNEIVERCYGCDLILDQQEELALSGIVLLDDDLQSSMIDDNIYEEAYTELDGLYTHFLEEDQAYSDRVRDFAKFMSKGKFVEAEEAINHPSLSGEFKCILYSLKRTYCKGYKINEVNESTTVKDGILPFFDNFFPNTKQYTTFGADKSISDSKRRFLDVDPSLGTRVKKADFSIVTNKSGHVLFALEAKPYKNKAQSKGDLTKMARYMKDTIDSLADEGRKDVPVFGMIASGLTCLIYVMEHKYDFLYTLHKINQFYIPVDYHDMSRIITIFDAMSQLRSFIQASLKKLGPIEKGKFVPLEQMRTYHTPIQASGSRIKTIDLNAKKAARKLIFVPE